MMEFSKNYAMHPSWGHGAHSFQTETQLAQSNMGSQPEAASQALVMTDYGIKKRSKEKKGEKKSIPKKIPLYQGM